MQRLLTAIILAAVAPTLWVQDPAGPSFEVASVKRNKSATTNGGITVRPGGQYLATSVSVRTLIRSAYGPIHDVQIVGGPGWMSVDRFDIIAKVEGNPAAEVFRDQARLMMRSLLTDRFKLALHREVREVAVYDLVIARRDGTLGPQLRRTNIADCTLTAPSPNVVPCGGGFARSGQMAARAMAFSRLAQSVFDLADRPAIDRTGLIGTFDWELRWTPDPLAQGSDADTVSLFTALQEQLGLKLESGRGPVDVVVIDRVEQPTPD